VQAVSNTDYLADNIAQVTHRAAGQPRDRGCVQVTGAAAGGWKIAQNALQTIESGNPPAGAIGNTWTVDDTNRFWQSVASSADGTRLVAVVSGGQIYTSTPTPMSTTTTRVTGAIGGRPFDAIDLQYVGNGLFVVRSSAGAFEVQ
jgi:hypothetical protein